MVKRSDEQLLSLLRSAAALPRLRHLEVRRDVVLADFDPAPEPELAPKKKTPKDLQDEYEEHMLHSSEG